MGLYAAATSVSSEKSKAEIEGTLERYGAEKFMRGWDSSGAIICFVHNGRGIKFHLPLPDKSSKEFVMTPGGKKERSIEDQRKAWEQACRQRWRALALVIKAKLEAVETGITSFEEEFLAHFVLDGGETIGQTLIPRLPNLHRSDLRLLLAPPGKNGG